MYSHEIENLLRIRNYLISNKEYFYILDTSPQIRGIEYKPYEDNFYMWTDDNFNFKFKVYKKEK
jgi:hypothetical protein